MMEVSENDGDDGGVHGGCGSGLRRIGVFADLYFCGGGLVDDEDGCGGGFVMVDGVVGCGESVAASRNLRRKRRIYCRFVGDCDGGGVGVGVGGRSDGSNGGWW
ncbi:hypothetical protein HanRHA438_Chr13g0583461 [Helianthus annuus]|nr:hypothetical protein HanHA300_Chr13g0469061 [Helianthus annuus]KAJ0479715.1 hypothetical protein HanIR_Chr13g0623241 [Helianthus annuus]KAJ0496536.1 hypothetical protein HanHA89_Chr13g0500911 [Helianthus annuus]KAJ0662579.1 hypothetical protein HanLR1_Chr13g0471241 [Helianthus annuus]KAJ0670098.1 hypothetical protein HanOQP8_Chr13g0470271 [Helianthus annuus]